MRSIFFMLLAALVSFGLGCVSKSRLELEKRQAYLAGQNEVLSRQLQQPQSKVVIVQGEVKNQTIPWTEGMTVAKAIVQAQYQGAADPKRIFIIHQGRGTELSPSDLLNGNDPPLEPGDRVVLKQD